MDDSCSLGSEEWLQLEAGGIDEQRSSYEMILESR